MNKRVIGWHFSKNEIQCGYCGKNGTTVIVEEEVIMYPNWPDDYQTYMKEFESCDTCTPPHSCSDSIADVFTKVIEKELNKQTGE